MVWYNIFLMSSKVATSAVAALTTSWCLRQGGRGRQPGHICWHWRPCSRRGCKWPWCRGGRRCCGRSHPAPERRTWAPCSMCPSLPGGMCGKWGRKGKRERVENPANKELTINVYISVCVSVMNWLLVQGVTLQSPNDSCKVRQRQGLYF